MDTIKYYLGIATCSILGVLLSIVVVIVECLSSPDEMLGIEPQKIEPEHDDLVLVQ